jgi:hypothetical protein
MPQTSRGRKILAALQEHDLNYKSAAAKCKVNPQTLRRVIYSSPHTLPVESAVRILRGLSGVVPPAILFPSLWRTVARLAAAD